MFDFWKKKHGNREKDTQAQKVKKEEKPEGFIDKYPPRVTMTTPRVKDQIWKGPRSLYSEAINYNLSLLTHRLPDSNLALTHFVIGTLSKTKVTIAYLKNKANPQLVSELVARLEEIKAEIIPDSSYIERSIEDSPLSPFPQTEQTTRPDTTAMALVQGRIGIFVDGTPKVLLAPTTFFDLLDTPDDAYRRWFIASSFFRVARYIVLLFTLFLPGFYIALTSFNPELIPTVLTFLIAAAREGNPLPIYLEAFIMMGVVEAVRMVNLRMPSTIGQSVSIFSGIALVIAGLFANFISAPIVIVVTLTVIASFALPNFDLRSSLRLLQFFIMIMATLLGLFGLAMGFFFICIHLASLKSLGISYMAPLAPLEASGLGHTIFRANTLDMAIDKTYKPNLHPEKGDDQYK